MNKWKGPPHEEIPRCGARTRTGGLCGHYSMKNGRCRYHGGKSTGVRNPHRPIKHGNYTKEAIEQRRYVAGLIKAAKQLMNKM
jgi:hypothetical protein